MAERAWHSQGDWQVGRIGGEWVVLARGGSYSNRRREDLALHVVAMCRNDLDAERIVAALRHTANEPIPRAENTGDAGASSATSEQVGQ